jgi:hypothetical protein
MLSAKPPQSGNDEGMLPMTCCDPLAAECPLDLTEDNCRALIRRFGAKPDKNFVDVQAASPSSWKTACMARLMVW